MHARSIKPTWWMVAECAAIGTVLVLASCRSARSQETPEVVGVPMFGADHPTVLAFPNFDPPPTPPPPSWTVRQPAKPKMRMFGFEGCLECEKAKKDIDRGYFGRVVSGQLRKHGDVLVTESYETEYVDVLTEDGGAKYLRLADALRAMGRPIRPELFDRFPTFHIAGRADVAVGYGTVDGVSGFRRLGRWMLETLRLPLTVGEGVFGGSPERPESSSPPEGERVELGESVDVIPEPNAEFDDRLEAVKEAAVSTVLDKVDQVLTNELQKRVGDEESLAGRVASIAVDRVVDRIEGRLLPDKPEPEDEPVPWGGGVTGVALALLDLWKRRAAA